VNVNVHNVNVAVEARSVPFVNLRLVEWSVGRYDVELIELSVVNIHRAGGENACALAGRCFTL